MELYAARHGQTQSSVENRVMGGGGDSPLTAKGIEQATKLGELLKDIGFDAVYSSPLNRAIDTVKIALGDKYQIYIDERLTGIGMGDMEGMTWDEAEKIFPQSANFLVSEPVLYTPPPNGEHLSDMIKRVDSFLADIVKIDYNKIFILTHGYVLSALHSCVTDKSISAIGKVPICPNCDLVHYIYNYGKWNRRIL